MHFFENTCCKLASGRLFYGSKMALSTDLRYKTNKLGRSQCRFSSYKHPNSRHNVEITDHYYNHAVSERNSFDRLLLDHGQAAAYRKSKTKTTHWTPIFVRENNPSKRRLCVDLCCTCTGILKSLESTV